MSFDLRKAKTINLKNEDYLEDNDTENSPEDFHVEKQTQADSVSWRAPEYEIYEKSTVWYLAAALILLAISTYAMLTNSPIMAITFILIGVVGYIYLQKEPRTLDFEINHRGVYAGSEFYDFDDIDSFWIFYDPPHTKTLSLRVDSSFMPFVHIPLGDEDPIVVREILMQYAPEEKQEAGLIDSLERFLHI